MRAFRLLGEAEGRIHGVPADQVALHEVGAMDALVDVVGAIEGFEQLGIERIYHRPVAVGGGWVRASHGVIPVPAPATAVLLEGIEVTTGRSGGRRSDDADRRGAAPGALVRARRRRAGASWAAGPGARVDAIPRDIPTRFVSSWREPALEAGEVVVLSTDLDDLSPEYLEPLREALAAAGALDVQIWATQMKKGRIGFRVEVVVPPAEADRVADALFRHSTTAGIRRQTDGAVTLAAARA